MTIYDDLVALADRSRERVQLEVADVRTIARQCANGLKSRIEGPPTSVSYAPGDEDAWNTEDGFRIEESLRLGDDETWRFALVVRLGTEYALRVHIEILPLEEPGRYTVGIAAHTTCDVVVTDGVVGNVESLISRIVEVLRSDLERPTRSKDRIGFDAS